MKRFFKTIQDLIDYIPNCIICRKEMIISIEGVILPLLPSKNQYAKKENVQMILFLKDGIVRTKKRNLSLAIKAEDNFIIDGQDIVSRLMINWTYVKKICSTCNFKINTVIDYKEGVIKKQNYFPPLIIDHEVLQYTFKGGKKVHITKYYNDYYYNNRVLPSRSEAVTIRLNDKSLPPVPLDLDKFKNLDQLNKRLSTIILFS